MVEQHGPFSARPRSRCRWGPLYAGKGRWAPWTPNEKNRKFYPGVSALLPLDRVDSEVVNIDNMAHAEMIISMMENFWVENPLKLKVGPGTTRPVFSSPVSSAANAQRTTFPAMEAFMDKELLRRFQAKQPDVRHVDTVALGTRSLLRSRAAYFGGREERGGARREEAAVSSGQATAGGADRRPPASQFSAGAARGP